MRLIDADALIRDIEHYHVSDGKFQHWVEVQPTIEERKTGTWNRYYRMHSGSTFVCNRCGSCFVVLQGENEMNFCPNCGEVKNGGM